MRGIRVAVAALILAGAAATAAVAAKPPSGGTTGTGQVFFPNPVATSGNQGLTDQKDAEYPALTSEYEIVELTNLDGSGYLRGDWANIRSETGNPAHSPTNTFVYGRDDDRFEQVMAYYWITEAQKYIRSLGFGTGTYPAVNAESQDLRINQWGLDNSFSWDKHDLIRLGKGGVDDAEDAEVILHEYGHAIHDAQVAGFGTSLEAGSIGEGFGDYWAVTVANAVSGDTYDLPCVADWDAISYTPAPHCLRRLDEDKQYPVDVEGEVHADGELWSQALWEIRAALGAATADTIILLAQFDFAPDTTFEAAAEATVAAAQDEFGAPAAAAVQAAFEARGIL